MEPQMHTDEHRLNALTERIIGCAYAVLNALGCGFLEKVYHNAMIVELRAAGLRVESKKQLPVVYRGVVVGDREADLLVEGLVLLELKAVMVFEDVHTAVCLNYLRATKLPLCLLLKFGRPKLGIKRLAGAEMP
jgi:GxxExxY protein